jgi:hypothetical protein
MKRWAAVLSVLVGAVVALGVAPPASGAPFCGTTWGSLSRQAGDLSASNVVGVRAGRHACYDRLVVDLAHGGAGYRVSYVDQVLYDASGEVVPLRGGARLQIVALAAAHDDTGNPTYHPADRRELADVAAWRTFRQVAFAGDFEGQTTLGLGVRARLPFRAFVLAGPGSGSRLVVDVAHHW